MAQIPDQKLQAFSTGSMGSRGLSKRELEEQRKKEEEEAAAHVYKEFVETFQEVPSTTSKVWVKAGTYDAGARKEDTSERGKLYKPVSRLEEKRPSAEEMGRAQGAAPRAEPPRAKHKHAKDKKKSNLELFKEELRQIQEEREERHKYKSVLRGVLGEGAAAPEVHDAGSYDTGDPNTTNLYLGNLNPKITEQQLMEMFGRYGPLASIKIMWPRSDEEKARGRNCGFVAFMSRKDGERALRCINGKEVMGYEMKLGWGKAVVIPPVPIYIPPALQQPSQPPPPSGLPFNAQPPRHLATKVPRTRPGESLPADPEERDFYDQILAQSIVKVVVPTERNILMLIHRMVEFVIREGPMFEAIIMNKEINNPFFRFLFENQSAAHVYYRWKLFSMLQGDTPKQWALDDFRMFKGGSVWRPPVMNLYTAGMPDDLVDEDDAKDNIRGTLSNNQRDRLEELLRNLTPERGAVAEAMAWCLEHAEAAGEIADCLTEALGGERTAPPRRIARLYLLSDILHNAGAKLTNASAFRGAFQQRLPAVMRAVRRGRLALASRLQAEGYRARVSRLLQAWADWAVYPAEFLVHLNDLFLGHDKEGDAGGGVRPEREAAQEAAGEGAASPAGSSASEGSWEGGGGAGPLDGAALRRLAATRLATHPAHPAHSTPAALTIPAPAPARRSALFDDIDGVPVDDDIDGVPLEADGGSGSETEAGGRPAAGFVPSRWESVEPAAVEAGAVTTSQWQKLAEPEPEAEPQPERDRPSTVEPVESGEEWALRRAALRELEVKVLKYADELETGRRALRPGLQAQQQVQHYRRKLLKKAAREAARGAREPEEVRAESPEPRDDDQHSVSSRKSKKSRELSLSPPVRRSRHRSRTRSRSRDRERERDRDRERERERERERRRRSPATPPHHHRKHKHAKHKY